jgi:DNA-directed RNA polymerase subunit delta
MAEDIMWAWETSGEAPELRRKFDDDEDEFEEDGFTFDDDEEDDEDLDDEDDLDDDDEDDLEDEELEEFDDFDEDEELR